LKQPVKNTDLEKRIFAASSVNFTELAVELFNFQYGHNEVYRNYCNTLNILPSQVDTITKIPFLPVEFFKTHEIKASYFEPEAIFESSGTTSSVNSRHFVKDTAVSKNFMASQKTNVSLVYYLLI
jgi:hypothetical protein